jgi:16S rRNA (cytosine1402-N4)-methyltransferase
MSYHTPVLLAESIEGLRVSSNGVYVDATFGGGGHSLSLLEQLKGGKLYVFDQDADAVQNIIDDSRLTFVNHNFAFLKNFMLFYGEPQLQGILADLGVSSHHFDTPERGFSFRFHAKLDMRMDVKSPISAYTVVNEYDFDRITNILREYGEIQHARSLARAIVEARSVAAIETTTDLKQIAMRFCSPKNEAKFLSQVFQAIRVEVNNEMETLKRFLYAGLEMLAPGGRFVVITYHSLEDRFVKNFFKTGNTDGVVVKDFFGNVQTPFVNITKKVCVPSAEEIQRNPRARSAKLRIAEKI